MSILIRLTSILLSAIVAAGILLVAPTTIDRARAVDPVPAPALTALAPDAGRLFPAFSPSVTDYLLKTRTTIETVDLGLSANDAGASVACTVDATLIDCAAVAIAVGETVVAVTVTAADAATAGYTVTINRADPSANGASDLVGLTASVGTLAPSFDPNVDTYALDTGTARSVSLGYTLPDGADASCSVDGFAGDCASIVLQTGTAPIDTVVSILVTALDQVGTTTYTITISRTPASDATLSTITLSSGSFDASFDPATSTVQSVTTISSTISLDPILSDNEATLACLDGDALVVSCADIALELVTPPAISVTRLIRVTAEDGLTVHDYPVEIRRVAAPSSDASLAALVISESELAPAFTSGTTEYSATTIATEVDVTATAAAGATTACAVDGHPRACTAITLELGETSITVRVTAADGVTSTDYTILLTREPASTDASLVDLAVSETELTPVFDPALISYTGITAAEAVDVEATPAADATMSCALDAVVRACGGIPLELGENAITITVIAQDGETTRDYTLTIIRRSTDASLVDLLLSAGVLAPAFDPAVFTYAVTTSAETTSIVATTADGATVTCVVSGTPVDCASVALPLGSTEVELIVTAEDTVTTAVTVITITRSAPVTIVPPAGNADSEVTPPPATEEEATVIPATSEPTEVSRAVTTTVPESTAPAALDPVVLGLLIAVAGVLLGIAIAAAALLLRRRPVRLSPKDIEYGI